MLKVHRDSIRILLPLFLGSFIMSAVFHWLAQSGSSWFGYGANVMIGIMGSSLLSLILAIVGYRSRDDKIIGVTVSDKAYYYFDYKERYEKSKGMG